MTASKAVTPSNVRKAVQRAIRNGLTRGVASINPLTGVYHQSHIRKNRKVSRVSFCVMDKDTLRLSFHVPPTRKDTSSYIVSALLKNTPRTRFKCETLVQRGVKTVGNMREHFAPVLDRLYIDKEST